MNQEYIKGLVECSEILFDRLAPAHKLKPEWKIYLTASVILRDLGELISISNQAKHTYYIVKNLDFPSMQKWEHEFIARLCYCRTVEKLKDKDLSFMREKDKKDAFVKLLSILRLVDALDFGSGHLFQIKSVTINRSAVRLSLKGNMKYGVEMLKMDRKKKLFEKTFHKKLDLVS